MNLEACDWPDRQDSHHAILGMQTSMSKMADEPGLTQEIELSCSN